MKRAIVVALAALCACGGGGGAVEIPPRDLPFSVVRAEAASPSPTAGRVLAVYFVRDGRLVLARSSVPATTPLPELAVRALLDGPSPQQRARDVTTVLPDGVRLLHVDVSSGVALVDLSGDFQEPAPPEVIVLRVAQVVFTLTDLRSVDAVRFAVDGEPIGVTTDAGRVVDRPVTRDDYRTVAPNPAAPPE